VSAPKQDESRGYFVEATGSNECWRRNNGDHIRPRDLTRSVCGPRLRPAGAAGL